MIDLFKNNAKKELECLNSLKFLLDENTIYFYNQVQGVIRYHSTTDAITNIKKVELGNPLYNIKRFYMNHLQDCETKLKSNPNDTELLGMIESDKILLNALTDEYIKNYEKVESNIGVVDRYNKFLSEDKQSLLDSFNKIYHNVPQLEETPKTRK